MRLRLKVGSTTLNEIDLFCVCKIGSNGGQRYFFNEFQTKGGQHYFKLDWFVFALFLTEIKSTGGKHYEIDLFLCS